MHDFNDLMRTIKQAGNASIEAGKPSAVFYGTVLSPSPIKINVEQKITLEAEQLVLTRNVTDFETQITFGASSYTTSTEHSPDAHAHTLPGKRSITVHNALKAGEKVLLLREQGGQRFIVIDRVVAE